MTDAGVPEGVGWTALLTAYGRAQESRRPDRLFHDALALAVVEAVSGQGGAYSDANGRLPRLGPASDDGSSDLWNAFRSYFTLRTPFYDQCVLQAVTDGFRQVVLLAAGLDSRAFRLGLPPETTVFELDQGPVLRYKESVVARRDAVPTCRRVTVPADLSAAWAAPLEAAGFDACLPTMWVAEGLLMYLTSEECDRFLDAVGALSGPGSRFAAEYFSRLPLENDMVNHTSDAEDRAAWDYIRQSFQEGPAAASPGAWLSGHGFTPGVTTDVVEQGHLRDRAVAQELERPGAPTIWLFEGTATGTSQPEPAAHSRPHTLSATDPDDNFVQ